MAKVQHISGITKRLPFEDLDFYDLFRVTFENSELGRMKRLLPLHEMAVNFGLVSNRYEHKRGPKPFFSPEGKVALMFLKMLMMIHYQQMGLPLSNDSLRMLYNLFLTDLSTVQQHSIREHRFPKRVEEIFLGFLGLLPQHFAEHHDIGFYASELCITTTYLSRVVRQVSGGRTVVDYINQMLLMEATFLLRQTSLSITQISDQLHFAEVTTFARFFNRMKGMNPREFRKGK